MQNICDALNRQKEQSMDSKVSAKKQAIQGIFDRVSPTYGYTPYFPLMGQWLADVAQISSGAHVLDVACGRGAVLFPAAQYVGQNGQIVGIDLSAGMVQETRAAIHYLGLTQAKVLQMDAEVLEFPDASIDYILCGFALHFFPHLEQTLSEFLRVLKPGGQVAVTTWGEDDQRWDWYDELRNTYEAIVKLASQKLDQPDDLFAWFNRVGFTNIQIITKELEMIYIDENEWWTIQWALSCRAGLELLEPKRLEQFKTEVIEHMQALREADGFHERLQAHCVVAVKKY